MKLHVDEWQWYIPEWNGNRKEKEPISIEIKYVTTRDWEIDEEIAKVPSGIYDREKIRNFFCRNVKSIKNLVVVMGGEEKELSDPGEFFDFCPIDLVVEVMEALRDYSKLTEGREKN